MFCVRGEKTTIPLNSVTIDVDHTGILSLDIQFKPATQKINNMQPEIHSLALPARTNALIQDGLSIVSRLRENGFDACWAGGCVRDMLLKRPLHDIDIATAADPAAVEKIFPGSNTVGRQFGVVRVPADHNIIEVATFRSDHGYHDGRHPAAVTFANIEQDAARRDFTINALFYDPAQEHVIDYVKGLQDLRDRVLRTVGSPERRFAEDYLRLLRGIRFACILGFRFEQTTGTVLRTMAAHINKISAERIREELARMFMEAPKPAAVLDALDQYALLPVILPEVSAMHDVPQPPQFHPEGDVYTHTRLMLEKMQERDIELIFAVLLHDIGKPPTYQNDSDRIRFPGHAARGAEMAEGILRRLKFSNESRKTIVTAIRQHMRFSDIKEMRTAKLRRWLGTKTFPLELELHRLDCLSSHRKMDKYEFAFNAYQSFSNEPVLPAPWISGKDIIALGISPGEKVGRLKATAYDIQLEGRANSRQELLHLLRKDLAL